MSDTVALLVQACAWGAVLYFTVEAMQRKRTL